MRPAFPIPERVQQKQLVARQLRNEKPLLGELAPHDVLVPLTTL